MEVDRRACGETHHLGWVALAALVLGACALTAPALAQAEPCPNEARRAEDAYSAALPDCRAYEQVSPVEKNYGGAVGAVMDVRGAPSGEAVTFASLEPFPPGEGAAGEGSSQLFTPYVSTRDAGGWSTQNVEPQVNPGAHSIALGVTEDLRYTFVDSNNHPPLTPEATEGREAVYIRDNQTGSYRLLFQLQPGEEAHFFLVDPAENDSRVFFESTNRILPESAYGSQPPGVRNLYAWHEGQLSLVDLLPARESGGVPAGGAAAGQGGSDVNGVPGVPAGDSTSFFMEGAVSEDGSRVFFTDGGTGRVYLRESQAGGTGETVAVSGGPAAWLAATPDGAQAFYSEGGVLYRFYAEGAGAGQSVALTPAGAEVLGTLGVADDGSYVYFAASAVLAPGAVKGAGNVYVWHEGAISLVTPAGEVDDWTSHTLLNLRGIGNALVGPAEGAKTSRVSADGRTLMFTSRSSVTGYDNQGAGSHCADEEGPAPCNEVYLYDATTSRVTCASCNPSGMPATNDALLYHEEDYSFARPPELYPWDLPRNLSVDGSRVFFETEEALVPQDDVSGEMNVYEWEREGAGSCPAGGGGLSVPDLLRDERRTVLLRRSERERRRRVLLHRPAARGTGRRPACRSLRRARRGWDRRPESLRAGRPV